MAKRIINGEKIEVGAFPYVLRNIGFRDAEHVELVAKMFGELRFPMRMDDVIEWFAYGNR